MQLARMVADRIAGAGGRPAKYGSPPHSGAKRVDFPDVESAYGEISGDLSVARATVASTTPPDERAPGLWLHRLVGRGFVVLR